MSFVNGSVFYVNVLVAITLSTLLRRERFLKVEYRIEIAPHFIAPMKVSEHGPILKWNRELGLNVNFVLKKGKIQTKVSKSNYGIPSIKV